MYKIFISFKKTIPDSGGQLTKEFEIARKLFEHLEENYKGEVFFSEECLSSSGDALFMKEIDNALNEAKVLIVVSDTPSYVYTNWVTREYTLFANDIASGRKEGQMYTLITPNCDSNLLPISLRNGQLFIYDDQLESLDSYIKNFLDRVDDSDVSWNALKRKKHINYANFPYIRHSFSFFVDGEFALGNENIYLTLYDSRTSFAMCLFNKVLAMQQDNSGVFYLDSLVELTELKRNIDIASLEELSIFVATVEYETELNYLYDFIAEFPQARFLLGVYKENREVLNASILLKTPLFHFDKLNFDETREFADFFYERTHNRIPSKFLFYLMSDVLSDIRTPIFLKTIFSSLGNTNSYRETDYNLIDVLEIIDNSCGKEVENVISKMVPLMKEKGKNRLLKSDLNINISQYLDTGLFYEGKLTMGFASQAFFDYKIAELIYAEYGEDAPAECFVNFKNSLPYFIYMCYEESHELVLLDALDDEERFDIVELFVCEDEAMDILIKEPSFRNTWVPFIVKSRRQSLLLTCEKVIECLEKNHIESNDECDYLSEKYLIYYFTYGEELDLDYQCGNITYYRGYVAFCVDRFEEAVSLFEKAYKEREIQDKLDPIFLLDYCEVVNDMGDTGKLTALVEKLNQLVDVNNGDETAERFMHFMGIVALDTLRFEESETYYEKCISYCIKNGDNRMLKIYFGDLGTLKMYEGKYEEAKYYLKKNLSLSIREQDLNGMAISSKILGKIALIERDFDKAYQYFSFAETYAEQAHNLWRLAKIRIYLCMLAKNPRMVEDYQYIKQQIPSPVFLYDYQLLRGFLDIVNGDIPASEDHFHKAYIEANKTTNKRAIARATYYYTKQDNAYGEFNKYMQDLLSAIQAIPDGGKVENKPLDFYLFTEIKTERLLLREMYLSDAEDIYEYASNPANTKYVLFPPHYSLADTYAYINSLYNVENVGYQFTWAIVINDKVIGCVDLIYNKEREEVELGYILSMKYWHKGYATEASLAVIDFARKIGLKSIFGVCFSVNEASRRVLERCGMHFERKIENYHDNRLINDKTGMLYSMKLND